MTVNCKAKMNIWHSKLNCLLNRMRLTIREWIKNGNNLRHFPFREGAVSLVQGFACHWDFAISYCNINFNWIDVGKSISGPILTTVSISNIYVLSFVDFTSFAFCRWAALVPVKIQAQSYKFWHPSFFKISIAYVLCFHTKNLRLKIKWRSFPICPF